MEILGKKTLYSHTIWIGYNIESAELVYGHKTIAFP